jgi:hypothetical protein
MGGFKLSVARDDVVTIVAFGEGGLSTGAYCFALGYNLSTNISPDPNNPVILGCGKRMFKAR